MTEKQIMLAAMDSVKKDRETLAHELGYSGQTAITNKLQTKRAMRVDTFVRIMDALGYDVIAKARSTKNKDEWIIDVPRNEAGD